MSSIPYNYGSYIDAKVAMTDTGHVSAGKQIQSPASAGSRGLAKTTQFTNDRTQMQMGNSPIAESMIEIRNILNRIDGVNVPVSEDDGDERAIAQMKTDRDSDYLYLRGKEIDQGSIMYDMQDYSDGIFELQSAKYADGTELDEKELEELESTQELIDWVMIDFVSESAEEAETDPGGRFQTKDPGYYKNPDKEFNINGMTTKKDVVQSIIDNIDNNELDTAKDSLNQLLDVVTALHDDYQPMPEGDEFDIEEDAGELSRLKELSGIKEDAGLTDEQKKGLEAIAKKYKDRVGGNGDMLAYGYLDISDTGIPTDGFDKEEMEAYSKKIGVDWREWDGEQTEDFLDQSETTGGATAFMIDDLIKVLGPEFESDAKLSSRAMDHLDSLDNNYEPFPEGDEFDIEEDAGELSRLKELSGIKEEASSKAS
jgi:hypothetical protein